MSGELITFALFAAFWISLVIVAACMMIVVIGPGNTDRVVALDLAIIMTAVTLGLFAGATQVAFYLDASLVLGILSFLVTVVLARLLETGRIFR